MNYMALLWNLFQMLGNNKKSRKEIGKLQKKKLRKIINYAYVNSAYYRRVYREAGMTEENKNIFPIKKILVINKQILMEHFDEIITTEEVTQNELGRFDEENRDMNQIYKQNYHVVHSSGSTGTPKYYVYDDSAWNQMLIGIIRGALWDMSVMEIVKLLWKKPRILYIAATDGRYGGAMAVGDGIDGLKAEQMHLDINLPLKEWKNAVTKFKPNIIIGYPSAVKILAGMVENGEITCNFSRIITCGEPLSHGLRAYLEGVFGEKIINFYGASESLALGVETDIREGMYLFDDLNYIEIIEGKIYITSLYNEIQPLIRYELNDSLRLKENALSGCHFTRVATVLGRDEDMMWFENQQGVKEFLHPLAVEGICIEGIIDYQFVQKSKDSFELLVETEKNANQEKISIELYELMDAILAKKKMSFVYYSVRYVDRIEADQRTGKKPLIVCDGEEGNGY